MKSKSESFSVRAMAVLLCFSAAALSWADEPSLYGAGVEESAILVRLVNAGAPMNASMTIGAQRLAARTFGDASAYKPVAADIYVIPYGGERYEFVPETESYYTLLALPGQLLILKDIRHDNPAKAQLYFYNASSAEDAELKSSDGKTRILGPVPPRSSAQAAVNAVSVSVATFLGASKTGADIRLRMERGSSYSIFLTDEGRAFLVTASVEAD